VSLRAGAAIGRLTVALRAQGIGWAWDPEPPLDADLAGAALDLPEGWRPIAVVAVGPEPEGGASRPRPPDPTDRLGWRD
jgi:nitroreductase